MSRTGGLRLLLHRLQIIRDILQTNFAVITVFLDLVEYRPPNGHFAGTMASNDFIAQDDLAHAADGKDPATSLGNRGEIGHFGGERRCYRAVTFAFHSVAGGAMSTIDFGAFQ